MPLWALQQGDTGDIIESFYKSGSHNTSNLLSKKDAVSESFYGMNLSWHLRNVKLGMLYSKNSFSLPVRRDDK